jgi:ribosome biogenesis GTPase
LREGVVVRAYGGFYYVLPASLTGEPRPCRVRGRLKRLAGRILVGERVEYEPPATATGEGVIEALRPRKVALLRPPVANVDQLLAVISAASPPPDLLQLDRLLCLAGRAGVRPAVCLNKVDLVAPAEADELLRPYRAAGFPAAAVSARTGASLDEVRRWLCGRVSVFAGRSGVGKTALANRLVPDRQAKTGEVSARLRQGRHTTRHAEFLALPGGGLLADTPGFAVLQDEGLVQPEQVAELYPEVARLGGDCRFRGCLHDQEPDCAVRQAVEAGEVSAGRYERYLVLVREARERRPW